MSAGATLAKLIRRETRKRGFFGKVFKWTFILFNCFMLYAMIAGMVRVAPQMERAMSEAERAGASIGTVVGVTMLALIWLAGAVVLGLFTMMTRGSKVIVEETIEA